MERASCVLSIRATATVERLVDTDEAPIDKKTKGGVLPLHLACQNNHIQIADLLLESASVQSMMKQMTE